MGGATGNHFKATDRAPRGVGHHVGRNKGAAFEGVTLIRPKKGWTVPRLPK